MVLPVIVEHRTRTNSNGDPLTGILLHEKAIQRIEPTGDYSDFSLFTVVWDDDDHTLDPYVEAQTIKWLSVPGVSDVEDSPVEDLLVEDDEEVSEEASGEPVATEEVYSGVDDADGGVTG